MKIQEAIEAAENAGESCIRRPIGIMLVRYLDFSSGLVMAESSGPLSGMTEPKADYALTADDLFAENWAVAEGRHLKSEPKAGPESSREEGGTNGIPLESRINDAAISICDMIVDWGDTGGAVADLKSMAEALVNIGNARKNLMGRNAEDRREKIIPGFITGAEGAVNNDHQQEAGQ